MQQTLSPVCNNRQTLRERPAGPGQEYSTWPNLSKNAASPVLATATSQSDTTAVSAKGRLSAEEKLIGQWVEIAMRHAITREVNDPVGFFARVTGIRGAWGFGPTIDEALQELESVLEEWVKLKLDHGDDDIPNMEGVNLVVTT